MATMWRNTNVLLNNAIASILLRKRLSMVSKCLLSDEASRLEMTENTQTNRDDNSEQVLYDQIAITVSGNDFAVLNSYTKFISMAAGNLNIDVSGKRNLPTKIQKFTLLKSPHIYKKHRTQYEVRTHSRKLTVKKLTSQTADVFLEYVQRNLPEGVAMEVCQDEIVALPDLLNEEAEKRGYRSASKRDE